MHWLQGRSCCTCYVVLAFALGACDGGSVLSDADAARADAVHPGAHADAAAPRDAISTSLEDAASSPMAGVDAGDAAGEIVGWGDGVTGGAGGREIHVDDWASLKAALEDSGPRIVIVDPVDHHFDGRGDRIRITSGDFTLDATRWHGSLQRGWVLIQGPIRNFIIRGLRSRPGDEVAAVTDADALSINAADGMVDGFVIDRCSLMWGSDIGGISLLGNLNGNVVQNGTIQRSVLGPGLQYSAHDEGTVGHAKAANITTLPSSVIEAMTDMDAIPGNGRITLFRNLITGGVERVPQMHYADDLDVVNNVVYNWMRDGIEGNPRGLNLVGNVTRRGPRTTTAGLLHYMHSIKPNHTAYPDSIYVADPMCIGFECGDDIRAVSRRSTPDHGGLHHVSAAPSSTVLETVLDEVGPPYRDSIDAQIVQHVRDGTDDWYNGAGFAPPNPTWPWPP